MIKAVLIDIDNTLLDFNKCAYMAMKSVFIKFSLPFSDSVNTVFKIVNDGLWERIEKKTLTRDELHEIRWQLIFDKLGIDFDGKAFEKGFLESLNYQVCFVDGAIEILEYLSSKYAVYTVSNAPKVQQKKRLRASGIDKYIKGAFISQEIGYDKPDKRFFDATFNAISPIKKEEAVLIGDSVSADIKGGIDYGIKTVWFDFERKGGFSGADYTVTELSQIRNIL